MNDRNFTAAFLVDQTPEEAFAAINDVKRWWTGEPGVEGPSDKIGDEFTYHYGDFHTSRQKVVERVPGKRVAWLVVEAQINFAKDKNEWNGTTLAFDIAKKGDKTEVRFTHVGLVPDIECYSTCSNAWGSYINGSLRSLIANGKA